METKQESAGRSFVAGAAGGAVAVLAMAVLAAVLMRRLGPRMMPRMMERMKGSCDSEAMRACMEKCGCGKAEEREAGDVER
jgi:TRAP-type C4-dicarboxylate transport system permease large subunit